MSAPRFLGAARSIAGLVATAVTVTAVGCTRTEPFTTDGRSSGVHEDAVVRLETTQPDKPVGVHFGRHAAIYLLQRDDPQFATRLAVLQRSLDEGTPVRFDYAVAGPRLTLVEPVK